jgi:hypothetical protein
MVSNVLGMDQDDLIELLKTFKKKYAEDDEYREARAALPKTWPF